MQSISMREVMQKTLQATRNTTPVAIIGEFNTGKGRLARLIHNLSRRSRHVFYELDCIALHPEQIRQELFGRMAYQQDGGHITHHAFKQANMGTLFIKSFNSLGRELQLHVMQLVEHFSTMKVFNANQDLVNVRLIISIDTRAPEPHSNGHNLNKLLDRINPIFIQQPPLRERREDLQILVSSFLEKIYPTYGWLNPPRVHPSVLYNFLLYDWPGNLRQLQNALEYALIVGDGNELLTEHLPPVLKKHRGISLKRTAAARADSFIRAEKALCQQVLQETQSLRLAAKTLRIDYKLLKQILNETTIREADLPRGTD